MGWSAFSVTSSSASELVATQLLELANDPRTWSLANLGATVIRRRIDDADRFYFSPQAVALFQPIIALHHGEPCDPPRVPAKGITGARWKGGTPGGNPT